MMRYFLCLTVVVFSAVSAENVTVYLEDHCDTIFSQKIQDVVTVRLARDGHVGRPTCRAQMILLPEENAQLFASFSEFHLTPAVDPKVCLQHSLVIGGLVGENQEHRVCGRPPLESLNHFLFSSEKALEKTIYYSRTVPFERNDAIILTVSNVAFADKNGSCPHLSRANNTVEDFRCESDSLCIPNFLRCDRIANCKDGSDENNCIGTTTTEPTTTSTTTVASLSPNKEIARGGDRQSGNSMKPQIIIGTVGGVVILALVAVIALFLVRRSRRRYHSVTTTHEPETTSGNVDNQEINTSLRQPEDSSV